LQAIAVMGQGYMDFVQQAWITHRLGGAMPLQVPDH
jgi:hypothetical protein